ncbi:hypothetical protein AVEN_118732-1 [Araneus ventricosus]|uniref:Uncharacterized protein n=1 Tax=Araneus ventricosus TaxID=182803 RepID=A0A4Y2BVF6_ARAVE|nr:hypothetical protein AVEN_118732-1 [Araneus ventricosus]
MKDGFAERFEQFKTNKSTLAFIANPLNTNTNEINIEPFGIDAGSLQMQLLDLKTKDLWSGKFTELKSKLEELDVQKCMHIAQQKWTTLKEIPRVEALIFGAWNSLPECYSEPVRFISGRSGRVADGPGEKRNYLVRELDNGCARHNILENTHKYLTPVFENSPSCGDTESSPNNGHGYPCLGTINILTVIDRFLAVPLGSGISSIRLKFDG